MKRQIIFVFSIFFIISFFNTYKANQRKRNNPFGGVEFNVHKREEKHIHIAALICALVETNSDPAEIKKALFDRFQKSITKSDKFLIEDSMFRMCPSVDARKIIDMNTLLSD